MAENAVLAIKNAGVVGAGGAGFPTHVKISAKADCVIINGAECEPLLRVDQLLMRDRAQDLLKGLSIVMDVTKASRGVIALKEKYAEANQQLVANLTDSRVEIFLMKDIYPVGDEQVLVRDIIGCSVPEGGIPLNVGCIVTNVETVLNIADALEGFPVTDTWLTVAGHVSEAFTCKVPLGTPMSTILSKAGIQENSGVTLLEGGPMMGRLIENWDTPVTKTTKGIIVLPDNHPLVTVRQAQINLFARKARSRCMQCARCTEACPRNLLGHGLKPHRIMRSIAYSLEDAVTVKSALLCSECGVCEYACPMDLSPRRINAWIKGELAKDGVRYRGDGCEPQVSSYREDRKVPVKRLITRIGLKEYDRLAPIKEMQLSPSSVKIKMGQHIGAPCKPLVQVGDLVQRGEVIGEIPDGKLGARVHASLDGIVTEQNDAYVVIEAVE